MWQYYITINSLIEVTLETLSQTIKTIKTARFAGVNVPYLFALGQMRQGTILHAKL